MAKYSLHIDCEDVVELAGIANRLAGLAQESEAPAVNPTPVAAEAPAKRGRKPAAATQEVAQEAPAPEPVAEPAPVVQSPPSPAPSAATTGQTATAPAQNTSGAVSYEDLKAALTKLMEKKSAKVAQDTLKKSVGFGSLSSTPPEKYAAALAAINAELEA